MILFLFIDLQLTLPVVYPKVRFKVLLHSLFICFPLAKLTQVPVLVPLPCTDMFMPSNLSYSFVSVMTQNFLKTLKIRN